ncbi:MAG TPA: PQQ-binding-like beta-propeller repeat protein [Planctomycetota bacterium]|nr:PQQ-binding-like beta-propeller repeat protein [Planctomycetota bacterium]
MPHYRSGSPLLLSALFWASVISPDGAVRAADWPQWRGPNRDGKSTEVGLLQSWPEGGPAVAWKATDAGAGYSSVSVAGGRVFTMGMSGGKEHVIAYSLEDGKTAWKTPIGSAYDSDRGGGPRGTPTVDGETLYALGAGGDLVSLKAADGAPVWQVNLVQKFGGKSPGWGFAESVLLDGSMAICSPGGRDASIAALDRKTGEVVWKSTGLSDRAGYASAIAATVDGIRQIIHFTHSTASSVRASDGAPLWTYGKASNGVANCATPVLHENHVFFSSDYGQGSALLQLSGKEGKVEAKEVYFQKELQNHHGGVILLDGSLYAHSGGNNERSHAIYCLDFLTGKVKWKDAGFGKCSMTYADKHLYCLTQDGLMGLVEVHPEKYIEKSRFVFKAYKNFKTGGLSEKDEKPTWAHPVVSHGKLFLRDQDSLVAYDVKSRPKTAEK